MLDSKDVGKGRGEPSLGEPRGHPLVVRWIGESDVVGMCVELRDVREDVDAMDGRGIARADLFQVGRDGS